ncbi:MAG: hypothetical protein IPL97_01760 [Niastella sp.]|nr:hypothetical protein [Niastella sp.]
MKTLKIPFFFILFLLISFTSCQNKTDDMTPDPQVELALTQGTWRVSDYTVNGSDQSGLFNGYSFTLNQNGTASANNGTITNGTWASTTNNGTKTISIDLGTGMPLIILNQAWKVGEFNFNTVNLSVSSTNPTVQSVLILQKN